MEVFVDGTVYDTNRATVLEMRDNGRTDSRWYCETLYKRNCDGALFLHAKGAPFSRYSEIRNRVCFSREAILPLSAADAEKWSRSLPAGRLCAL
jgi:hypothetical protein